MVDEVAATTI